MRISCAVRALNKMYCTNVSCEWVSCPHEVLRVTHAGDQHLRLFAERIEFLSLVQIQF